MVKSVFCPRVAALSSRGERAASRRALQLDISWDVAALPGGLAQVVCALRSLPLVAVGPETQLETGWEYPQCLGHAASPARTSKQVVWSTMTAAPRDLLPHLSWEDQDTV